MEQDLLSHYVSLALLIFCGGALLSLIARTVLRPSEAGGRPRLIYGFSLFACGLCSYLYTTRFSGLPTHLLRQFDHAAIFLLIAGTYTPFAGNLVLGPFRVKLLYWIWGLALTGALLCLVIADGYEKLFLGLYLSAGWLFVTALPDILKRVPRPSLIFLGAGAVVYTAGAILFALDPGPWTVAVWHVLVLIAAALHFTAVLKLNSSHTSTASP